jgi:hypothetical protein
MGQACDKSLIISEIAKWHGPEWSLLLKSSSCSNASIKNHLRLILANPQESLSAFDAGNQQFLYRNAVKSFGHFSSDNNDLSFISKIYNDQNHTLQNLFGENANLFRITVLESMANTGNLEALDFFQKIMENDNNVLFLQQRAADFALWVLDGSPYKEGDLLGGSRDFAEHYYPNLNGSAEERFKGDATKLEKLSEKKDALKLLLADMLQREDKFKEILPSLKTLLHSLENRNSRKPQSLVESSLYKHDDHEDHDHDSLNNQNSGDKSHFERGNKNGASRETAGNSEEENSSLSLIIKILLFALLISFLLYYSIKSKRP